VTISKPNIAFATYHKLPDLNDDDALVAEVLRAQGATVDAVQWDSPSAVWESYDAVVIRSTWDYYIRAEEFFAWFNHLEKVGAKVHNPISVLRWNSVKTYLRQLEGAGVPIVPTQWAEQGATTNLKSLLASANISDAVIKPVISGGAWDTWRLQAAQAEAEQSKFEAMQSRTTVMIQPFVPEVTEVGEWSLIYFNGVFSHAVLKRPGKDDFRVQPQHGGTSQVLQPPDALMTAGVRVLNAAKKLLNRPDHLLYARVDGLVMSGVFRLMELEVIEPRLFFVNAPSAAERFAAAILARL
jgi:glutathione synthase/RimK-type ligase-like ATP-grasp enzyme